MATIVILEGHFKSLTANPYHIGPYLHRMLVDAMTAVVVRKADREMGNFPPGTPQETRDWLIAQDASDIEIWRQLIDSMLIQVKE